MKSFEELAFDALGPHCVTGDERRAAVEAVLAAHEQWLTNADLENADGLRTINSLAERSNAWRQEAETLRAALQHEADCVEAAKAEIASLRASLQVALSVLDDVRGNINPERGYADELEEDVENAIASIILRAS